MVQSKNEVEIESPKDLARLIKKTKLVVIKFSASWCGPCKSKSFLDSYNSLKLKYKTIPDVDFVEFDIDKNSNIIDDSEFYNISIDSVPSLMITRNGNFTKKYEGTGCINNIDEYLMKSLSN
jgi:thiol-disulfide isomerase/thioredoxin